MVLNNLKVFNGQYHLVFELLTTVEDQSSSRDSRGVKVIML